MKAQGLGVVVLCAALAAGCNNGGTGETGGSGSHKGEDAAKRAAELNWAEGVADTFLSAVQGRNYGSQVTITTEAFRKAHKETGETWRLAPDLGINTWNISEKTLAPDGKEARFAGTWSGTVLGPGTYRNGSFSLLLTREEASGKWLVNSFAMTTN